MSETKQFFLYGLARTGTNFFIDLVKDNFGITCGTLNYNDVAGWKHHPVKEGFTKPTVCTNKDPFSWCESQYSMFMNKVVQGRAPMPRGGMDLKKFIRTPFAPKWIGDYREDNNLIFETPIEYWNEMNGIWMNQCTLLVRYEELIQKPLDILDKVGKLYQVSYKGKPITKYESYRGPDVFFRGNSNFKHRSKYENKNWMKYFNEEDIQFIKERINMDVAEAWGYNFETN